MCVAKEEQTARHIQFVAILKDATDENTMKSNEAASKLGSVAFRVKRNARRKASGQSVGLSTYRMPAEYSQIGIFMGNLLVPFAAPHGQWIFLGVSYAFCVWWPTN